MKKKPCLSFLVAFIFVFASSAAAAVITFTPRITVSEEYTDNVNLTDSNSSRNSGASRNSSKEEDYITTISPGFSVEALQKHSGVNLHYTPTYAMYKENTKNDTWRHNAGLAFWSDLSKRTHLTIRDNFRRTEESSPTDVFGTPLPEDSILDPDTTTRRGRTPYSTNAASAGLRHQFGEKDSVSCGYLYSFRTDDAPDGNDNERHAPHAALSYWFTPQYGLDTRISYTRGEFDRSEDFDDWTGSLKLSRLISKQLSVFTAYRHTIREFKGGGLAEREEPDYKIYEPSVGFTYQFTEDMWVTLGGGYFHQDIDNREEETGYLLNADINKTWVFRRGSIRLAGSAGLDRNEFGTENIGVERFYGLSCSASYALTKRLSSSLNSSYRRNESLNDRPLPIEDNRNRFDNRGQTTDNVRAGVGLSYTITPWLYLRTNYSHNLFRSDREGNDYDENIVTVSVTAVPERPFRYLD